MENDTYFSDRLDAAEKLAARLSEYQGRDPLVLAIPRGAVPMARLISQRLQGELDIVLVHKLGAPFDPEYAIGAVDEGGWTYLGPLAEGFGEHSSLVRHEKDLQLEMLKRRREEYTPHRQPIDAKGRVVIVVDDGMATGSTMIAALHAIRAKKPAELICAVPVAPKGTLARIAVLADRVVCLCSPRDFFGISQFYRAFPQVSDDEVVRTLAESGVRPSAGTRGSDGERRPSAP